MQLKHPLVHQHRETECVQTQKYASVLTSSPTVSHSWMEPFQHPFACQYLQLSLRTDGTIYSACTTYSLITVGHLNLITLYLNSGLLNIRKIINN